MRIEGHVGTAKAADGQEGIPFRQGTDGDMVVRELMPKYYEQALRGNMYLFSNAAAGVAPVAATTTNAPFLWNPLGSGKNLIIVRVVASLTATGTTAAGSIVYLTLPNAGANIGTAAPVVSGTFVAGVNCLLGAADNSGAKFAPATVATTGTPTLIGPSGFGQATAATTAQPENNFCDDVDGKIIIPPGNTFQIGASGTIASTYCFGIYVLSLPVPNLAA